MYETCLATVPLTHNQPINVTYPVVISALHLGTLNRLMQREAIWTNRPVVSNFDVFIGLAENDSSW